MELIVPAPAELRINADAVSPGLVPHDGVFPHSDTIVSTTLRALLTLSSPLCADTTTVVDESVTELADSTVYRVGVLTLKPYVLVTALVMPVDVPSSKISSDHMLLFWKCKKKMRTHLRTKSETQT